MRRFRPGFTLIELTIALMIAALATSAVISSINAITNASLRSSAVSMAGSIKMNYDRAVMSRRTQRLAMDIDKGTYWIEFTESPFALNRDRTRGDKGEDVEDAVEEAAKKATGGSASSSSKKKSIFDDDKKSKSVFDDKKSVFDDKRSIFDDKNQDGFSLEAGQAAQFAADEDPDLGKPVSLPKNVHFGRIWTGHQEEPFSSGIAFLHFFPAGYTEPAVIELIDEGDDVISVKVEPLTGRVRTYDKRIDIPKPQDDDGRKDGDL